MTHYDSNCMQFMLFATIYRFLPCVDFVYLQYDSNCTVHNTCYLYLQFLPCVHSALATSSLVATSSTTAGRVLKVTTLRASVQSWQYQNFDINVSAVLLQSCFNPGHIFYHEDTTPSPKDNAPL